MPGREREDRDAREECDRGEEEHAVGAELVRGVVGALRIVRLVGLSGLSVALPPPGSALLLRLLRVTKSRRSAYDALMLNLHDRMKEDAAYQQTAAQTGADRAVRFTFRREPLDDAVRIAFENVIRHAERV